MNLLLAFTLSVVLSAALPRGGGAARVDELLRQYRVEMAENRVDAPAPVEPAVETPALAIAPAVSTPIPLCQPNAPKTGLPPTSLCRIENVQLTLP